MGVVSIELLLLMPFFGVLLFSVYLLGDIMFVQEKTELAARYVAWKRIPVSEDQVRKTFFPGQDSRTMVQGIEVTQGLSDRRYPKRTGSNDAEVQQTGALGSPPRFLFDPLNSAAHSTETLRAAHIVFEGNTGGGNKASHQSYFGVDQPAKDGGGGWVVEQWGAVLTSYRPMGYTTLSLKLAAAHKVLMGKQYHAEITPGWWASTFRFREAAVTAPGKSGIADAHDDVNTTSWEYSGLMKELFPQP